MPNGITGSDEDEVRFVRAMAEHTRTELAVMQEILSRLEESLFGSEKRPGIISIMEKKLNSHEKVIYVGMGIIIAMQFLSGNGIISLKGLMGK